MAEKDKATDDKAPEPTSKHGRTAALNVKYNGTWYAPGVEVPFKTAKDAERYEWALAAK